MDLDERAGTDRARLLRIRVAVLAASVALFALLYVTQPVLPLLAHAFGRSPASSALALSATTAGVAVAGLPIAILSERAGRRRVMVLSLAVAALLGLAVAAAPSFGVLVALRAVQGVALAGVPAVAMSYLAEETPGPELGATMGLFVAGQSLGGMTGRLVAGITGDLLGWRAGLLAVGVVGAVATVVFALLLPAPGRPPPGGDPAAAVAGLRAAVRDPVLYGPYAVAALGMGAFVATYNVLTFRLVAPPFAIPAALASLVFVAYLAGGVAGPAGGRAADRFGRPRVLAVTLAATALGLLAMTPPVLPLVLAGLLLLTGGFFASHAVAGGWVGVRAAPRARSQASALYLFAYYAGSTLGGVAGPAVYASAGWPAFAAVAIGWLALAGAAVALASRRSVASE